MERKENSECYTREAFLDIETTGLSPKDCEITVVGLYMQDTYYGLVNGFDLTSEALHYILEEVDTLYTFNGRRFDIPFIRKKMGVDVDEKGINHIDILYECRSVGLRGGQKVVEKLLCLTRGADCLDGRAAARLGKRWLRYGDMEALDILMRYNEDDLRNLGEIKKHVDKQKSNEDSCKNG